MWYMSLLAYFLLSRFVDANLPMQICLFIFLLKMYFYFVDKGILLD